MQNIKKMFSTKNENRASPYQLITCIKQQTNSNPEQIQHHKQSKNQEHIIYVVWHKFAYIHKSIQQLCFYSNSMKNVQSIYKRKQNTRKPKNPFEVVLSQSITQLLNSFRLKKNTIEKIDFFLFDALSDG